jgi:hypothetical protein
MSKGGRPKAPLNLSDDQTQICKTCASRPKSTQRLETRASIVLASAEDRDKRDVATRLRVNTATVGQWHRRFLEQPLVEGPAVANRRSMAAGSAFMPPHLVR